MTLERISPTSDTAQKESSAPLLAESWTMEVVKAIFNLIVAVGFFYLELIKKSIGALILGLTREL